MINHHALFKELLDRKLSSEYNGKIYPVNFTEGDLFELWKVLQSKKQKYPIIWLQTGYKIDQDVRGNRSKLQRLRFFFITKGSMNDFYHKRFKDTFQSILYPLLKDFLNLLRKNNGIHFGEEHFNYVTLPFNDISELDAKVHFHTNKELQQNATTPDIWDAILLTISLDIDNHCNTIKSFKI